MAKKNVEIQWLLLSFIVIGFIIAVITEAIIYAIVYLNQASTIILLLAMFIAIMIVQTIQEGPERTKQKVWSVFSFAFMVSFILGIINFFGGPLGISINLLNVNLVSITELVGLIIVTTVLYEVYEYITT